MSDIYQDSLKFHKKNGGKLETRSKVSLKTKQDLSLAYTPGVAEPCRAIAKDEKRSFDLTWRGRAVAVVSDGSAVLGLGNIGAAASLPVMEGKSVLMREFGGVDSIPLVIDTQDPDEIIKFVKQIAPSFVGINLEDIAAPNCFIVEDALQNLPIAVFHDDQHGTAIVVLAALLNAAKVVNKKPKDMKAVIIGAGAAGIAITQLLMGLERRHGKFVKKDANQVLGDVILVDSKGAICSKRQDLNDYKHAVNEAINKQKLCGTLEHAVKDADIIIGVSKPNLITSKMIKSMSKDAIIFAMANPTPEIMPDIALAAGAKVVATGRSDFANQVNNVLVFPGIFKAVADYRLTKITTKMKIAAAHTLAKMVKNPTAKKILPNPLNKEVASKIAKSIGKLNKD